MIKRILTTICFCFISMILYSGVVSAAVNAEAEEDVCNTIRNARSFDLDTEYEAEISTSDDIDVYRFEAKYGIYYCATINITQKVETRISFCDSMGDTMGKAICSDAGAAASARSLQINIGDNFYVVISGADKVSYTLCVTPVSSTISYELNGGSFYNDYDETFIIGMERDLDIPSKKGYVFDGWYINSNFSGSAVTKVSTSQVKDLKIYARWEKLNTPRLKRLKKTSKGVAIDLKVKRTKCNKGFEIQYSTSKYFNKDFKKIFISTKSSTAKKTVKGLKKGKTYYFRVRAVAESYGQKHYSTFTKIKTVKM